MPSEIPQAITCLAGHRNGVVDQIAQVFASAFTVGCVKGAHDKPCAGAAHQNAGIDQIAVDLVYRVVVNLQASPKSPHARQEAGALQFPGYDQQLNLGRDFLESSVSTSLVPSD